MLNFVLHFYWEALALMLWNRGLKFGRGITMVSAMCPLLPSGKPTQIWPSYNKPLKKTQLAHAQWRTVRSLLNTLKIPLVLSMLHPLTFLHGTKLWMQHPLTATKHTPVQGSEAEQDFFYVPKLRHLGSALQKCLELIASAEVNWICILHI